MRKDENYTVEKPELTPENTYQALLRRGDSKAMAQIITFQIFLVTFNYSCVLGFSKARNYKTN